MANSADKYLIVIAGPTASGKTDIAIQIASHFKTEIISADARQFYKEMKIGTAVPDEEQLRKVKHHFIHNISIRDQYDVGSYENDVLDLLDELFKKKDVVILAGGSGLFIKAICEGLDEFPDIDPLIRNRITEVYQKEGIESLQKLLEEKDPEYYAVVDKQNPQRIMRALEVCLSTGHPFSSFRKNQSAERRFKSIKIFLNVPREELYNRINQRVDNMFEEGLEEEARTLYPDRNLNSLQTVGYSELFDHFDNKTPIDKAKELIKQHTRNYAKRQITWFKRDAEFVWLSADAEVILNYLNSRLKQSIN